MIKEPKPKEPKAEVILKAANIHEAMLAVYKSVGYVQRKGYNDNQKYNFAGEADFIEALRPAMIENEIIIYTSGIENPRITEIIKESDGNRRVTLNVSAVFTFCFTHVPSKTFIHAMAIGEGADGLDKASYKAMTGAYKYALRQSFLIETGNDPDESHSEPEKADEPKIPSREKVAEVWENWYQKTIKLQQEPMTFLKTFADAKTVVSKLGFNYWELANHTYPEIGEKLVKNVDTYCKSFE